MFSTNYDDLGSGGLLPAGKYETIIKAAQLNETKNGTPYIDIRMVIRNDVDQAYKNKYIFHAIWKKKEPTPQDMSVDGYSFKQLMGLAKAARLPNGKNYKSIDELCKDFVNRCVNVEIEHKADNNGVDRERVKYCNETECPECKHVFKEAEQAANNSYQKPKNDAFAQPSTVINNDLSDYEEVISDDECPF